MKTLDLKKLKITDIFKHFEKSLNYKEKKEYKYICLYKNDIFLLHTYSLVHLKNYLPEYFNKKIFISYYIYKMMRLLDLDELKYNEINNDIYLNNFKISTKIPNEIINFENKIPEPPYFECNILTEYFTPYVFIQEPDSNLYACVGKALFNITVDFANKLRSNDLRFYCVKDENNKKIEFFFIDSTNLFAIVALYYDDSEFISNNLHFNSLNLKF